MKPDRVLAFCPSCKETRRFSRVEVKHRLHGILTVVTLGLWGVSWLAVSIGQLIWPWRCRKCGCNAPDLIRPLVERSKEGAPAGKAESER
jgi:hypothetical protein